LIPDLDQLRIQRAEEELGPSPAKRRWRLLLIIGGGLIVVLAALYLWGPLKPAQEVTAAVVSRIYPSQAYTLLNASGYVVPQRQAAVSSKSTGRLVYLGVEEGSRVKKGQVMATLENDDLVAQRNQAAAQVNDAKAALDTAQAELVDARLQYERFKTLVQQDLVARQDFDSALARYQKAQAQVAGAQAQIRASQANLANTQAALEYSYIRSPFDGVVLTKNADVGEVVAPFGAAATAKASVVTMADFDSLMVEADVAEANLDKVHQGQPCEIALDAIPNQRFRGEVHMIVPTADRAKATVMTKVKFLEMDDRILPEMSAKVAFLSQPLETGETKPLLAVNKSALITRNGKSMAFLIQENRVRLTEVATGEEMAELVQITGGLKEGDRVVLNPPASLKNGDRVKIKGS
jgi:RND family efflux transporter MFP subunit